MAQNVQSENRSSLEGPAPLRDILNPEDVALLRPGGEMSRIAIPPLQFLPGTFVAVVSGFCGFDIGEVISEDEDTVKDGHEAVDVIRVRWYLSVYSTGRIWASPTIESLLCSTYFPIADEDLTSSPHWRRRYSELHGTVGIMEVLVSFPRLRMDHRIPFHVRKLILKSIGLYEETSKKT